MDYLISVVVPAYNAERTIERCINSIQDQTYKNLEILVVNDGSSDATKDVLERLKTNDKRIKVFSISNSGVSHARNIGIDNSRGDFITFVDSDDYIDSAMYYELINLILKYNVRIAHCSYENVNNKGDIINKVGDTGKITIQNHDEAIACILSGRMFSGGTCNKLYSNTLFKTVRFDESIRINEDVLVNYQLFDLVPNSVYIDRAYYSYVENEDSATHSMRSNVGIEHGTLVAERMAALSFGKPYQPEADRRYAICCLKLYNAYLFSHNPEDWNKRESIKIQVKSFASLYAGNNRIKYILLMFFPFVYKPIYRVYSKFRKKKLDPTQ